MRCPVSSVSWTIAKGIFERWLAVTQESQKDQGEQSAESFRGRMQAQCCRIQDYRLEVLHNEGRRLSHDEAALEWIERYAEAFAEDHDSA